MTLSQAAPAGGTAVSLSSNNALLPVPAATITVPAGSATTTFNATAGSIPSNQNATLTATLSGVSQTATINLSRTLTLSSLSCNPTSLASAAGTTCTVTLSQAAPAGGTAVSLSSNNALLPVPGATITVPAGSATTTFNATAGSIPSNQNATLTATLSGVSQTATISLASAMTLSSLSCNPTSLTSRSGHHVHRHIEPGGSCRRHGGFPIQQQHAAASSGAQSRSLRVRPRPHSTPPQAAIPSNQNATLTATLSGVSQTATISLVSAMTLSSLSCNPTSLTSGAGTTCTVTLSEAAPAGGTAVSLSSNNALLPVPGSTITVPAGSATTTFNATAGSIPSNQNATLTATLSGVSQTATISLSARGLVLAVVQSHQFGLRSQRTVTVTLSQAAPAGGTAVSLSSNNTLLPVPAATITVPAGSATTTFNATAASSIPSNQSATLTATLSGVSQTATISLTSATTVSSLSCNPTSLASGASATCTVTLSQAAPSGGTAVSLSSSNALLPVPAATITVPAGSATTTFNTTAGTIASNQSVTLTATLSGVSQTSTISLMAPVVLSSLSCNPTSLATGAYTTCTVTLSQVAPAGGTAVSLSSNNTLLPAPRSTTVPAGSSTTTFIAIAGSIVSNQSATLTATLSGVSQTAAISLVSTQTLSSLACNPTSLPLGASGTCTAHLNTAAPAGGTMILLSSNNPLLFVAAPAVTVPAGATSTTFSMSASLPSGIGNLVGSGGIGGIPIKQSATLTATLNSVSKLVIVSITGTTSSPTAPTTSRIRAGAPSTSGAMMIGPAVMSAPQAQVAVSALSCSPGP